MIWKTRNIRPLFNLKDKASHILPVVYEGKCNCGENYIGETGRNVTVRWDEHSNVGKNSGPAKHLNQFPEHRFTWKIPRRVPNKVRQRKIHEVYYVMGKRPTLNNQLELTSLTLGVCTKMFLNLFWLHWDFIDYSDLTFDKASIDLRKRSGF